MAVETQENFSLSSFLLILVASFVGFMVGSTVQRWSDTLPAWEYEV